MPRCARPLLARDLWMGHLCRRNRSEPGRPCWLRLGRANARGAGVLAPADPGGRFLLDAEGGCPEPDLQPDQCLRSFTPARASPAFLLNPIQHSQVNLGRRHLFHRIQHFATGIGGLGNVSPEDFGEGIPRALQAQQQLVNVVVNGDAFWHTRELHEPACPANPRPDTLSGWPRPALGMPGQIGGRDTSTRTGTLTSGAPSRLM